MEGVNALLTLCKTYLPKSQSQNLMMKVIQVVMDRIKSNGESQETEEIQEKAIIAVLIIVEKFANESIFEKTECESFLTQYVPQIKEGMLFKIKKFLLPALIACSKHIPYETFIESVYNEFK